MARSLFPSIRIAPMLLSAVIAASSGFYARGSDIARVQAVADSALLDLSKAQLFNSTFGLSWSDAFIGTSYPFPARFGIGLAAGATEFEAGETRKFLEELGYGGSLLGNLSMPSAALEARIGGILLPFDVGFKVDIIPDTLGSVVSNEDVRLKLAYRVVGMDVRCSLLRNKRYAPDLSVGIGYNHAASEFAFRVDGVQRIAVPGYGELTVKDADVGIAWSTSSVDYRLHASKRIFFLTPYAGVGAAKGWSRSSYSVEGTFRKDSFPIDSAEVAKIRAALGLSDLESVEFSIRGFASRFSVSGWMLRAYGGGAIEFGSLFLDLSWVRNFSDGSSGFAVGLRLQR